MSGGPSTDSRRCSMMEPSSNRRFNVASTLRRTWAEIDLDSLARNYRKLKAHIGENVKFMGIVKADAYGHGSVQVSRCL